MNRTYVSALTLALAALAAGQAYAATDASLPKSRAQVKAELAEAIRTGDIVSNLDNGLKLNELFPARYPAKAVSQGLTREQVKAELAEAVRKGDIVSSQDNGQKLNELFPARYSRFN